MHFTKFSGEVILLFYSMIFSTNIMILPQLLLQKICERSNQHVNVTGDCQDQAHPELQKETSIWWFGILVSNHVPAIFIMMIWGPMTDVIGRKYSTIYVTIISIIQNIIYLVNSQYMALHPGYLFFGSILSSFYGEFQGVILLAYACVADSTVTDLSARTMRMLIVESVLAISGLLAGVISGQMLHHYGFVYPFLLNVVLATTVLLYALCVMPSKPTQHSHSDDRENTHLLEEQVGNGEEDLECESTGSDTPATENGNVESKSKQDMFSHFKSSLSVITDKKYRRFVIPLFLALGLSLSGILGEASVQVLYVKNEPFKFSADVIGYYVAMQSLLRGFSTVFVSQLSYRWLHLSDYTLMIIGIISEATAFTLVGLSRSKIAIFLSQIPGSFMFITLPAIRSHITKELINDADSGTVLASFEVADVLFDFVSSSLSLWVYHVAADVYTGLPYFVLSGLCILALVFVLLARYKQN